MDNFEELKATAFTALAELYDWHGTDTRFTNRLDKVKQLIDVLLTPAETKMPLGIISLSPSISDADYNKIVNEWEDKHGGEGEIDIQAIKSDPDVAPINADDLTDNTPTDASEPPADKPASRKRGK